MRGDAVRDLLAPTDLDELLPIATQRYPSVLPAQSINRYLADVEKFLDDLGDFLAGEHTQANP